MPTKDDVLEVGYWEGQEFNSWKKIGETKSWNYHKGCRLQWIDDCNCIYNVVDGETVKSQITNITTGKDRLINWPIDTVSSNGRYATTFSYERLQQ